MNKGSRIHTIDKIIIILIPIIVSIISVKLIPVNKIETKEGLENCKMMLDIWGVMLGFVITALSILLTVHENRYVKMLIDTKHFTTVLFSYMCCCIYLFISVVISIILIYSKYWNDFIYMIFKGLIVVTICSLGITLLFMIRIIFKQNDFL